MQQQQQGPVETFFVVGRGNLLARFLSSASSDAMCAAAVAAAGTAASALGAILSVPLPAEVLSMYPTLGPDELSPQIATFCLPDGLYLREGRRPAPYVFSFVLTGVDGTRRYVTCLTIHEPVETSLVAALAARVDQLRGFAAARSAAPELPRSDVFAPKCLCLLASVPCYTFCREWLCAFHRAVFVAPEPFYTPEALVATAVRGLPLPAPGGPPVVVRIGEETLPPLALPNERLALPLLDVPLLLLFHKLGTASAVHVLKAILLGEKVLFVSSSYTLLTLACEGFSGLIYPFRWAGPFVYIPVLPAVLVDCLESPTCYLIGTSAATFRRIPALPPDVTVVNLDANTVSCPAGSVPLPPFPEQEEAALLADVGRLLEPDARGYDTLDWRAWKTPFPSSSEQFNLGVRSAFLKFFASLFRDHRDYAIFQRVLPQAALVFDDQSFIKSRRDAEAFLTPFLSSQLWVCFIEERPWPMGDLFDWAISKKIWDLGVEQVAQLLTSPPALGAPIVIKTQAWSTASTPEDFFVLNESDIESEPVVRPTVTFEPDASPPLWLSEIPPVRSYAIRQDLVPKQWMQIAEAILTLLPVFYDEAHQQDVTYVTNGLKQRIYRMQFCAILLAKSEERRNCRLNLKSWSTLTELIQVMLEQDPKDYAVVQQCLEISERFYYLESNIENFIVARLRNLPLWQDIRSWQFIFAVRVHNSLRSIYKSSVIERWSTLDAKSKLDFEDSEWGHIQTHIVTLTSKMSSLGLSPVLIGRFARGVCMNMRVPPEREASLMKLIKCIPEDTEVKPLQPEPPTPALTEAKFVVLWVESKILQPVPKAAMIAVKQAVERTISPVVFCGIQSVSDLRIWLQKYSIHVAHKLRVVTIRQRLDGDSVASERVIAVLRTEMKLPAPILVVSTKAVSAESLRSRGPDIHVAANTEDVTEFIVQGRVSR